MHLKKKTTTGKLIEYLKDRAVWLKRKFLQNKSLNPSNFKKNLSFPKRILSIFKFKKLILLLILLVFLFVSFSHISVLLNSSPKLYNSEDYEALNIENEYNLIIYGVDTTNGYTFLDSILLLSIKKEDKKLKLYAINPTFVVRSEETGTTFALKSLYNNTFADAKLNNIKISVENLLGLKTNGYLTYEVNELAAYLDNNDYKIQSSEQSDKYKEGVDITGSNIADYLFKDVAYTDVSMQRQLDFFSKFIINNSGTIDLYRNFWQLDELSEVFYTSLDKSELFDLFYLFYKLDLPISTNYLSTNFGQPSTNVEGGLIADNLQVDESVLSLFNDINILKEQASIEVYNASNKSGVAYMAARLIRNKGGNVVKYGNYNKVETQSTLYILTNDQTKYLNTINLIKYLVGDDIVIKTEGYQNNYIGDLILIIGE